MNRNKIIITYQNKILYKFRKKKYQIYKAYLIIKIKFIYILKKMMMISIPLST